ETYLARPSRVLPRVRRSVSSSLAVLARPRAASPTCWLACSMLPQSGSAVPREGDVLTNDACMPFREDARKKPSAYERRAPARWPDARGPWMRRAEFRGGTASALGVERRASVRAP